jgi:hypothetical protein
MPVLFVAYAATIEPTLFALGIDSLLSGIVSLFLWEWNPF